MPTRTVNELLHF